MSDEKTAVHIDLPDMRSRAEHGMHLTNDEVRWLLAQVGYPVPRKRRCERCNATGDFVFDDGELGNCGKCHGAGYLPVPEAEYEVVRGANHPT